MLIKAPLSNDIGLNYHDQQFDAKLIDTNVYRLNGSDEVDAAWEELGISCELRSYILGISRDWNLTLPLV